MLFGYGRLLPVSIGRIGSASGTSDSAESLASIGQLIPRAPSDNFRLFADGDVNVRPLLAAPTDRLWPVPTTPSHNGAIPPPSSCEPFPPPPPQPIAAPASATAHVQFVKLVSTRIRGASLGQAAAPENQDRRRPTAFDRDDA